MGPEFTILELTKEFSLPEKQVRNLSQRLPIKPCRRVGRVDLYDLESSIRMVLCARLRPVFTKNSLLGLLSDTEGQELKSVLFLDWNPIGRSKGVSVSLNIVSISHRLVKATYGSPAQQETD